MCFLLGWMRGSVSPTTIHILTLIGDSGKVKDAGPLSQLLHDDLIKSFREFIIHFLFVRPGFSEGLKTQALPHSSKYFTPT